MKLCMLMHVTLGLTSRNSQKMFGSAIPLNHKIAHGKNRLKIKSGARAMLLGSPPQLLPPKSIQQNYGPVAAAYQIKDQRYFNMNSGVSRHNVHTMPIFYAHGKTTLALSDFGCGNLFTGVPFSTSSTVQGKKNCENEDGDSAPPKSWKALLTVPNILTVTRMVLTPYLGYLVLSESYELACGVFLFAGITDLLDGWIARKFPGQSSPVGSFLDPLADKFLVSTLFVTLSMVNLIPVPLTVLVVARDVSLIGAAFYVRIISLPSPVNLSSIFNLSNQTAELKPTFISKLNTVVQLGLVVASLCAPVFNFVGHPALQTLWYTTAGTTFLSGIVYIFADGTFRVFKERKLKS